MTESCGVCGGRDWKDHYAGPIRDGVFGRDRDAVILSCGSCGAQVLREPRIAPDNYYEGGEYRADVGEQADVRDYFTRHDAEQWAIFDLVKNMPLRDRRIADIGCGGGSLLDAVSGVAAQTVAIEPARFYHDSLRGRGHKVYGDVASAVADLSGTLDVVFSLSVIEHIDRPAAFLAEARQLLNPSGVLVISTPNLNDVLLTIGCEAYRRFFYRVVHRYYLSQGSLQHLARAAGFGSCQVVFRHRFGFGNFVTWVTQGRPGGHQAESPLGPAFDGHWKLAVEQAGQADYLYAYLRP